MLKYVSENKKGDRSSLSLLCVEEIVINRHSTFNYCRNSLSEKPDNGEQFRIHSIIQTFN